MTESKTLGKYTIVSELGRGGMGVVYKAWEESLQRFVAIKMLGDQLTQDATVVGRFLREARAVADLHHPNIVQVFAVDTFEGRPYFAMEYVEGESLTELIRTSRRIEPKRAVQLLKEAATGLVAAHAKDVVHRDIKPDNIMLTKQGGVKVVDFGIAKVDDPDSKLTATGMMVGTPNYISPEVCLGRDVDARSDIFSLGIVFYEMLAGETPFQADSPIAMMTAVVQAEVPDITALNPAVDENVRLILKQMLQKEPGHRYQDCQEIIADLDCYLAGAPPAYAVAAENDATLVMNRPVDINAATLTQPAQPHAGTSKVPGVRRTGQLGWVIGLLLIFGAAAGGWYYTGEQEPAPNELSIQPEIESNIPSIDQAATAEAQNQSDQSRLSADSIEAIPGQQQTDEYKETIGEAPIASNAEAIPEVAPTREVDIPVATTGPPNLVVIAFGDPAVSTVVESVIEGALTSADYPVLDEQLFSGLTLSFTPDLASIGKVALENGADILIVADLKETGQRQLSFYGRTEQQTIANLQVRAMLLSSRQSLGAPWFESMEYVPLKASETAREIAEPIAQALLDRLDKLAN